MQALLRLVEWIVITLMAAIAALVIVEVTVRDFLDMSIGVHEELTRYLMIWVVMLGSVLLTSENRHIRISILPDMLTGKWSILIDCIADIIIVFFLAVFTYACATNLPSIVGQDTVTLGIGMIWFHAALPVGGIMMLLIAIIRFVTHMRLLAGHG